MFTHWQQGGEGRPRLEAVLGGETRSRESPPIPAVLAVAVEVCVAVEGVVRVCRHPSFPLGFSAVCGTGDEEGAALVLLKETDHTITSYALSKPLFRFVLHENFHTHLLDYGSYVAHIQRHIVVHVQGRLGGRDVEPVGGQRCLVLIVAAPNDDGRMRLEALNLISDHNMDHMRSQSRKISDSD